MLIGINSSILANQIDKAGKSQRQVFPDGRIAVQLQMHADRAAELGQ